MFHRFYRSFIMNSHYTFEDTNTSPTAIYISNGGSELFDGSVSIDSNVIVENSFVSTGGSPYLGYLSSNDAEGGMITYSITSAYDGIFEILNDNGGGKIRFKDNVSFDYETDPTIDVTITATDLGGLSYDQTFTFNVVDDPSDNNTDDINQDDFIVSPTYKATFATSINNGKAMGMGQA